MADHLQYRGADVEAYTPHGDWLIELLHLAERRDLREFILSALSQFLTTRNELAGAAFDQRRITWDLPDISIILEKRGDKVNQGSLVFQVRSLADQAAKESNRGGKAPF